MEVVLAVPAAGELKCVNLFKRYLTVWVRSVLLWACWLVSRSRSRRRAS
ncbi:hypothetical protein NSPZN2_100084 [Nitrospira defluvii]|uniref:Uncharacterized protein n=1 Tax=Nitrospira defluvii TaxID=330214 RepID=A0ABM8QZW7_9BACT|nr:hypothetical protein NSPZN2_100084 [Nitrospira defluvii]